MSAPPYDLSAAASAARRGWHEFFHAPIDPRPAALVRIVFAALVLIYFALLWPEFPLWFSEEGVLPLDVARDINESYAWSAFFHAPASLTTAYVCGALCLAQAGCLLVGLASRFSAAGVFVWLVSFQHRNPLILDGEDAVFRLLAFFLIFAPCGRAWSVDALLRRAPAPTPTPAWGLRLLQIQVCLVVFMSALQKLRGAEWWDGTALYYVARLDDYFGRGPLPDWLFESPWLVRPMTWSVLAVELVAPVLVWFRQTRRATIVVLIAFHLLLDYAMHLFLFEWVMIAGWLAFTLPEDWEWLARRLRRPAASTSAGTTSAS